MLTKIVGPPGTGKTTKLLNILEEKIEQGIPIEEICFVSFTRKAIDEAKDRACEKFNIKREELVYFRTLHSLALRLACPSDATIVDRDLYANFCKISGVGFSGKSINTDDDYKAAELGDRYFHVISLARNKQISIQDALFFSGETIDFNVEGLEIFSKQFLDYKQRIGAIDYDDMLHNLKTRPEIRGFKVLILDESQDFSTLQWDCLDRLIQRSTEIFVAGDDDQAIYTWSGADVNRFIDLEEDELLVLNQSYRIPKSIYALSKSIVSRIPKRIKKQFKPREEEGSIEIISNIFDLHIENEEQSILLLARHNMHLKDYYDWCMARGLNYRWGNFMPRKSREYRALKYLAKLTGGGELTEGQEDHLKSMLYNKKEKLEYLNFYDWPDVIAMSYKKRGYYQQAYQRGTDFEKDPLISISTVHAAKGGEADIVVLRSELTQRSNEQYLKDPDLEHRTFYVGVTRTKHRLVYIKSQSDKYYPILEMV